MTLIQKLLEEKNQKIFLQMGGQGSPWYRELKKLYDSKSLEKFFDTCFNAIDELRELTQHSVATPQGLRPREWLENESTVPSEDYLSIAGVSLVMIQMTQLAYFEQFRLKYPYSKIKNIIGGASGHSQGLISMTLAALGLEGEEYYEALRLYMKYIVYLALRAQEVFPELNPSKEELELAEHLGLKDPSPMVAVLGNNHKIFEELVEKINTKLPESEKIYIGLYNTPTNRVLSSERKSLLLFYKENKEFLESNKIKYIFLKTTCPFHSPYMEQAINKVLEDMNKENFSYDMKDLKFPVYTFSNGQDYNSLNNLLAVMTRDLLVSTLYWNKVIQNIKDRQNEIAFIIDFGPGKTSQRLTQEILEDLNLEKSIYAMANPKESSIIL